MTEGKKPGDRARKSSGRGQRDLRVRVKSAKGRKLSSTLWLERPELLETPLPAPIIVIGHMRSGTTRIHTLLAADPAHSHTRYCDAYHPVPARLGMNRVRAAMELAMLGLLNPWMQDRTNVV